MTKSYYIEFHKGDFTLPPIFSHAYAETINAVKNEKLRIMKKHAALILAYGLESSGVLPPYSIIKSSAGKPYLLDGNIYFSYTHTEGLCAAVISSDHCGIDSEPLDRIVSAKEISRRFFSPEETRYLEENRFSNDCFLKIWTQKEAYLKKLGTGLSGGLGSFSVFSVKDTFLTTHTTRKHIISVCASENSENTEVNINRLYKKFQIT